jgi:muramoyltetrapeptide carboxypeptidase
MHILPFVDWDAVRANPKVFCGYSDITGLHLAIRREANVVTFHGTMTECSSTRTRMRAATTRPT